LLRPLKVQMIFPTSENYPFYRKNSSGEEWCVFNLYRKCFIHTGSKFTFIFGHFRSNLGHLLLGNHGNPEQKAIIFRNTLTRTTQKCIYRKFWEILKIKLVRSTKKLVLNVKEVCEWNADDYYMGRCREPISVQHSGGLYSRISRSNLTLSPYLDRRIPCIEKESIWRQISVYERCRGAKWHRIDTDVGKSGYTEAIFLRLIYYPCNNIRINSPFVNFGNKFHLFPWISLAALVKFVTNCVKFISEVHAHGVD